VRPVTGDVPKAVVADPVAAPGKSMETKGVSKVSLHLPPQLEILKTHFLKRDLKNDYLLISFTNFKYEERRRPLYSLEVKRLYFD